MRWQDLESVPLYRILAFCETLKIHVMNTLVHVTDTVHPPEVTQVISFFKECSVPVFLILVHVH